MDQTPESKPNRTSSESSSQEVQSPSSTGLTKRPSRAPGHSRFSMINRSPRADKPPRKGTIYQLEIVFGVAVILATLFTAWTPGRSTTLFAPPTKSDISKILQPTPTLLPGVPTVTLKNPRLIGIVAGHYKNDSGAVCADGIKEVDLNLNIATKVQKILTAEGYQVDLLQEFDPRLSGYQSAALISIHNDSCEFINNDATGFKVAAAFATRHPERAARLTSCLRARYGAITGMPLHSTSVTPDMTSYHAFEEIDEITPAAIIETGFMNLDRTILTQQPDRVAQGVSAGILCYMRNESVNPTPPASGAAATPLSPTAAPAP